MTATHSNMLFTAPVSLRQNDNSLDHQVFMHYGPVSLQAYNSSAMRHD